MALTPQCATAAGLTLIITAGKAHQPSARCAKANESFTRQLDCRQILNHSKMSEKNDKAQPKSKAKEKPMQTWFFDPGRNTNWLTGYPDGKPKPSEVTTTHKIGKGFK